MAQIGAGFITVGGLTTYPYEIDSKQDYQNGSPLAPDSDSRLDAEVINDIVRTLVNIETVLGAAPQGIHGSVLARLIAIEARLTALEGP